MARVGARVAFLAAAAALSVAGALPGQTLAGRVIGGYGFGDGYGGIFGGTLGIEFPLLFGRPAFVGAWGMYNAGRTFEREEQTLDQRVGFVGIEGGGVFLEGPIFIRGSQAIGAAFVTTEPEGRQEIDETRLNLSGGVAFGRQFGRTFLAVEPYTFLIVGSENISGSFVLFLTVGFR